MENETKRTSLDEKAIEMDANNLQTKWPAAGLYISAKNYRANQRVKVRVTAFDRQGRSAKFGTWQVVYDGSATGAKRKIGLSAMLVKALKGRFGIKNSRTWLAEI